MNPEAHSSGVNAQTLYPLVFEPTFQYRLWGGRRLARMLRAPLPGEGPVGEAWLLSDRDDQASVVANGPLRGQSLRQLLERWPEQLLGKLAGRFRRFPLLLKFLDARELLSVQVHPSDEQPDYLPAGESGKTEAWIVIECGPKSCVYAGLKPGTTAEDLRGAIAHGTLPDHLAHFSPSPGECIFLQAGTVHSLGDLVVFEVQQNSDVTFRLDDWSRVDASTGQPRALQVEQALACIDFARGAVEKVTPTREESQGVLRERIVLCEHFGLWRVQGTLPFAVGAVDRPRVLVCLDGLGDLQYESANYSLGRGDVMLLPAVLGACQFQPRGSVSLLELSLPEDT
jgi:mannose-6-phosphate isomerase